MKYVQFVRSVVSSRIPHFLSYDAYLSKSVVIDTLQAVAEKKKHFQKTPDKCIRNYSGIHYQIDFEDF